MLPRAFHKKAKPDKTGWQKAILSFINKYELNFILIELSLQGTVDKMKFDLSLYLVTDSSGISKDEFLARVKAACEGGITLLQLREKERGGREYFKLAEKVKKIADGYGVPLIIDDRVDIALAADCAGVHVGQSDMPVCEARKLLGEDKIVGATAKTVEQALKAKEQGADYLGVGAIYPTTTKVKTVLTKVSTLSEIKKATGLPIVAIGGLNADNYAVLNSSGADGIAVVTAIMKSSDPKAAAEELLTCSKRMRGILK